MFELIKELLVRVWNFLKKIFLKIVNFLINISGFFKRQDRLEMIKQQKKLLAIAIKEKLANGDYQVVNCLFNEETSELVAPEQHAEVVTCGELDNETVKHFGNKDMIVLT